MRRVVKVGGSLLIRSDLKQALTTWLDSQSKAETLVVVGGGELIDAIRHLDRTHPGNPIETHWLCVDLLEATCRLCASWFDWKCVHTSETLQARIRDGFGVEVPCLISVSAFYDRSNAPKAIPQDWRTTTDTIAALLARIAAADELVLLKSCPTDPSASVQELADQGIVDEALPLIESTVPSIRVTTLRE